MKQSGRPEDWKPIDGKASRLKRMQRGVLTAARLFQSDQSHRWQCWMVTLTYRPDVKWQAKHIRACRDALRKWCERRGIKARTVWVLEQHKSGRVHYHLCIWLPLSITLPHFDDCGWWPHGMTRTERAKFAPGYLAKYVSKGVKQWDDEVVPIPKGARLYGIGGLDSLSRIEWRWWMFPRWMREAIKWLGEARRTKGGYVCKTTGEIFETPYQVRVIRGRCWYRMKDAPHTFQAQPLMALAA